MVYGGQHHDGETAMKDVKQSKVEQTQAVEPVQAASKLVKDVELFTAIATKISANLKSLRSAVIELENRKREAHLALNAAESNLKSVDRKAQLAVAQSTSGVRALADRVAVERGEVEELKSKLKMQEMAISSERRELEELKAEYTSKLDGLKNVATGVK